VLKYGKVSENSKMKVTVLGSGTSQGMPVIACDCSVCASNNPKDNRLRSSIMLTIDGKNYVIDTGPDFRQQMLREKVQTLEAVIFTHEHKDHVAGMDDIRAFNFKEKRDMEIYCTAEVEVALKREFSYIFSDNNYPGIPKVKINRITNTAFSIGEIGFTPIQVMHFKMPVLGFRIGDFAYITDAKTISNEEKEKLKGTKVLIINALRITEHISHFNLEQALAFIEEIKPERAYLTHISHLLGRHDDIQKIVPKNVFLAYDGLVIQS
jgi:phosphoribosyl 1,2-cyclic phosphate phosphodiesterase